MTSNMSNSPVPNAVYTTANGTTGSDVFITFFSDRDPTVNDINFPVKKRWINTTTGEEFILQGYIGSLGVNTADWLQISQGSAGDLSTLSDNAGTIVTPSGDSAIPPNNIQFISSDGTISIVASPANTLDLKAGTPLPKPSFSTYLAVTVPNVAGDGVPAYTIAYDTIQFDTLGNVSSGIFTAPVDGNYQFNFSVNLQGMTVADTNLIFALDVKNAALTLKQRVITYFIDPSLIISGGALIVSGSAFVPMLATDTAQVIVQVSGSTRTVSAGGSALNAAAGFFSGFLVV